MYMVEMKAVFHLLLAPLAAGAVLPRDGNGTAIGKDDFVYVDGLRLYDSKGLYYLTGNTSPSTPDT